MTSQPATPAERAAEHRAEAERITSTIADILRATQDDVAELQRTIEEVEAQTATTVSDLERQADRCRRAAALYEQSAVPASQLEELDEEAEQAAGELNEAQAAAERAVERCDALQGLMEAAEQEEAGSGDPGTQVEARARRLAAQELLAEATEDVMMATRRLDAARERHADLTARANEARVLAASLLERAELTATGELDEIEVGEAAEREERQRRAAEEAQAAKSKEVARIMGGPRWLGPTADTNGWVGLGSAARRP